MIFVIISLLLHYFFSLSVYVAFVSSGINVYTDVIYSYSDVYLTCRHFIYLCLKMCEVYKLKKTVFFILTYLLHYIHDVLWLLKYTSENLFTVSIFFFFSLKRKIVCSLVQIVWLKWKLLWRLQLIWNMKFTNSFYIWTDSFDKSSIFWSVIGNIQIFIFIHACI